jgi:hypothetical protein
VHGFYAAMGGYVIQSHSLDNQYPINGQGRLTLTNHGVLWLLRTVPELFPDLNEDEILDKSKASTLVKALTCLQALWFCLQCIVRLTMNASISLLELNVFGHCICTFIIYAIWWNKPVDICKPTLIVVKDKPELQGLIALLCSYTSRAVPQLPLPLREYVFFGYEYRLRADKNSCPADDDISLSSQCSRQLSSLYVSYHRQPVEDQYHSPQYCPPERRNYQDARFHGDSNISFDTMGSSYLDSRSADDDISLDSQHSRGTQDSYLPHNGRISQSVASQYYGHHYWRTQRNDYSKPEYSDNLNTWFDATGFPIPDGKYSHQISCDPSVTENEEQIYEYAGLDTKRIVQLLHLDKAGPRM